MQYINTYLGKNSVRSSHDHPPQSKVVVSDKSKTSTSGLIALAILGISIFAGAYCTSSGTFSHPGVIRPGLY